MKPIMRSIFLAFATLLSCPFAAQAEGIKILNWRFQVTPTCTLQVTDEGGKVSELQPPFKTKKQCQFLVHDGTDVPKLYWIRSAYVALLESRIAQGSLCQAELVALKVDEKKGPRISKTPHPTGTCGYGERKEFEILSHKL